MRERAYGLVVVALTVLVGCGDSGAPEAPAAAPVTAIGAPEQTEPPPEGHRRRAILEKARQRGAVYWGTGNEPGWTIEIGPTQTTLVTNYGSERFEFATPQPTIEETRHRTIYRTRANGHEILAELTQENCADSMSDETFSMTVRIELDGRELKGCGVNLADPSR